LKGFQPAGLVVEVSEIVMHEADEPNAVVGLLDSDVLAGKDGAEIDLSLLVAYAAAGREGDCLVVERVVEVWQPPIDTG